MVYGATSLFDTLEDSKVAAPRYRPTHALCDARYWPRLCGYPSMVCRQESVMWSGYCGTALGYGASECGTALGARA
eukprot:1096561-Rhodomonas_salina.1